MLRRIAGLIVFCIALPALAAGPVVVDLTDPSGGSPETTRTRKALADMTLELDQLRTEVRELRGQVEMQTHELESLKTRQREALADADKRLRELERGGVPAASAPSPGVVAAPPAAAGEQQEYDAAFGLLKAGYYERAAKSFRQFVAKYPQSELAGNAQLWIGESYYALLNFKLALDEFGKVPANYPSSPKVPDALLKIGYCHSELGAYGKAREVLQQVIGRYPNTTVARLAEVRLADIKAAEAKTKPAPKPAAPKPASGSKP